MQVILFRGDELNMNKSLRKPIRRWLALLLALALLFTLCPDPPAMAAIGNVTVKTLAAGTKFATKMYIIDSGKAGPTVMITGGIHGNEKAGYTAAGKLTNYSIKKGKLIVIPRANVLAIAAGKRSAPGYTDLNRQFPTSKSGAANGTLAKAIMKAVRDYDVDWLMDMHEGYNYAKVSKSAGQSVIYYPSGTTVTTAKKIVNTLNKDVTKSSQKFSLLRYPASGSLARAAALSGANAFIFETCTKDKLSVRVNYQLEAAEIMMKAAGII